MSKYFIFLSRHEVPIAAVIIMVLIIIYYYQNKIADMNQTADNARTVCLVQSAWDEVTMLTNMFITSITSSPAHLQDIYDNIISVQSKLIKLISPYMNPGQQGLMTQDLQMRGNVASQIISAANTSTTTTSQPNCTPTLSNLITQFNQINLSIANNLSNIVSNLSTVLPQHITDTSTIALNMSGVARALLI